MVSNGSTWSIREKRSKTVKLSKMVHSDPKASNIDDIFFLNDPLYFIVHDGPKWSNGPKLSKIYQYGPN